MHTTKVLLGMRIREVRKLRSYSQEKLAEKVGVDPKQISRIEGGKSAPSLDTLEAIATHLQVEIKDLFEFGHLSVKEPVEVQALKSLELMDEKTRGLAARILRMLIT